MALAYVDVLRRQHTQCLDALHSRGIRVAPLIAAEYSVLGDRRERQGDRAGARRFYRAALRAHPSARPLFYLARTWLPARDAASRKGPMEP